jgi:hypothetical protein
VPSADARIRAVAALALLAVGLVAGGCDTTQQKSARAKLQATRLLASRRAVVVRQTDPRIAVQSATLVRGPRASAVVVRLRNHGPTTLQDLPVTVGLRRPGRHPLLLNARRGVPYLQTHAPAIAAGGQATWVFVARRRVPHGGRVFARVGPPAPGSGPARKRLVSLRAAAPAARAGALSVSVENPTAVPQYGLDVYAYVTRAGRYVAAGRAAIAHLGTGSRRSIRLHLVGNPRGGVVHVLAPPSTLR